MFFIYAGIADGAGVFAAVAGVKNNDLAGILAFILCLRFSRGFLGRDLGLITVGRKGMIIADLCGKFTLRSNFYIHDETITEAALRRQHKSLFDNGRFLQIKNYPGCPITDIAEPGSGDQIIFIYKIFNRAADLDIAGINDQPFGTVEQKNLIVKRTVRIEHQTNIADPLPDPQRTDSLCRRGRAYNRQAEKQQQESGQNLTNLSCYALICFAAKTNHHLLFTQLYLF